MQEARRGLFLDLDGTLADSLPVMRAVYERFLQTFNRMPSAEEFSRLNGPPLAMVVAMIADWHKLTEPLPRLIDLYWSMIDDAYGEVAANPGAVSLLQTASKHGWRVCIVTSNRASLAQYWLKRQKLSAYIAGIIGSEHVTQGKPMPEPYLLALRTIGCDADNALAIEDSVSGARAAITANIRTFFLMHSEPPPPTLDAEIITRLDAICPQIISMKRGLE